MTDTVLIAEDDLFQRAMMTTLLESQLGYRVVGVENGKKALDFIQGEEGDTVRLALLDLSMPVMNGLETLQRIRQLQPDLPVIMLTADANPAMAVRAIKEGAYDYINKPPQPDHLRVTLANALKMSALTREVSRLKRDREGAYRFDDLIGHASGLDNVVKLGRRAAAADVPVLIHGETGVGKEQFARAIHGESRRAGAPFIALNCGAIPEKLVESTLFGHEKGAFTGAIAKTHGKFHEAEGGTIFLDEIGELPADGQVKLLRVLQQQEVEPVGAARPVKVNVRVLSATNRDLKAEVKAGRFREDLYFRLNVLPVTLPPLRERTADILPLAHHFLERFASTDLLPVRQLAKEAEAYLMSAAWPGNVRELENLMHRALVLCEHDIITREDLEHIHGMGALSSSEGNITAQASGASTLTLQLRREDGTFKTTQDIEKEAMQTVLSFYQDNITRAAEALGMAKSTFYRKLKG